MQQHTPAHMFEHERKFLYNLRNFSKFFQNYFKSKIPIFRDFDSHACLTLPPNSSVTLRTRGQSSEKFARSSGFVRACVCLQVVCRCSAVASRLRAPSAAPPLRLFFFCGIRTCGALVTDSQHLLVHVRQRITHTLPASD